MAKKKLTKKEYYLKAAGFGQGIALTVIMFGVASGYWGAIVGGGFILLAFFWQEAIWRKQP